MSVGSSIESEYFRKDFVDINRLFEQSRIELKLQRAIETSTAMQHEWQHENG